MLSIHASFGTTLYGVIASDFGGLFKKTIFFPCLIPFLNHLQDDSDVVFKAVNGKWRAVVVEISRMHKTGRAVLVGTTSVEQSDELSQLLQEAKIPHEVMFSCNIDKNSSTFMQKSIQIYASLVINPKKNFLHLNKWCM